MSEHKLGEYVKAIRGFNRFYTRKIGVVGGTASSPFSLAEARVLFELARRESLTATDIRVELGLDAGYTSRILREFERRKLVSRQHSRSDRREKFLALTAMGKKAFAALDERANHDAAAMVKKLTAPERKLLAGSLQAVRALLEGKPEPKVPYLIRLHQPGDLGWVVHRQALLYAEEYGWDNTYEALAAEIVAQFIRNFDLKRERCWIVERNGRRAGAVFVAKATEEVSKLRLLHVEAEARGMGIGKRLVEECVRFARQAGYRKMTLWTQSMLHAARHIYKETGFQIVRKERHHSFGKDLVAETWELKL